MTRSQKIKNHLFCRYKWLKLLNLIFLSFVEAGLSASLTKISKKNELNAKSYYD